jgi:hypothetical protein
MTIFKDIRLKTEFNRFLFVLKWITFTMDYSSKTQLFGPDKSE